MDIWNCKAGAIKMIQPKLTERQKERFIELYPTTPNKRLAELFSIRETTASQYATRYGVKKSRQYFKDKKHSNRGNAWTDEELDLLEKNYKHYSDKELRRFLPNRSTGSISAKRNELQWIKKPSRVGEKRNYKSAETQEVAKTRRYIIRNEIAIQNTKEAVDNVLNLYNITEKIADKIG